MNVDPAIVLLAQTSVSLLFAVAGVHKLLHPDQFVAALDRYELAGRRTNIAIARVLPLLELVAAIGIWSASIRGAASLLMVALLAVYAAAIAINLARGRRDLDCGCTAFGRRSPISGWILVRILILGGVAVLASAPIAARALTLTDALTVAGGLCVLTLLYIAADGLLATGSREIRS